jgi:hypothetical protein
MPQAAPRISTEYKQTGSDTVNGFSCTKYEGSRSGQKVAELCAADPGELKINPADFGVFLQVRDFAKSLQDSLANSPFGQAASGGGFAAFTDAGFEGFPVTNTSFDGGKAVSRDTIESVEQVTVTDADFQMPAGAKPAQIPGIGGR